jgi:hypothetical protein
MFWSWWRRSKCCRGVGIYLVRKVPCASFMNGVGILWRVLLDSCWWSSAVGAGFGLLACVSVAVGSVCVLFGPGGAAGCFWLLVRWVWEAFVVLFASVSASVCVLFVAGSSILRFAASWVFVFSLFVVCFLGASVVLLLPALGGFCCGWLQLSGGCFWVLTQGYARGSSIVYFCVITLCFVSFLLGGF